jgi:cell division protease FtsH
LNKQNVVVEGTAPQRQGILMQLLIASFPVLLIILLFMFFMRNMGGGAGGKNGPMSFGKSKAKMLSEDQIKVRLLMLQVVMKQNKKLLKLLIS